jgi:fructose-1,6-bisphosphatase II / sedoheptulose-1,7-bisphosphatase
MIKFDIYEIVTGAVEKAALSSFKWIDKKDNVAADQFAVSAMRNWLIENNFPGKVVIGEGERDQAPMLYIGEQFSKASILYDIAVDPLEGTNLCANNLPNSMSVIAIADKGTILNAPDLYMQKIAVSSDIPYSAIDLNLPLKTIINNVAQLKNKPINQIMITILDRERHKSYIDEALEVGVKLNLIEDGDVLAAINCSDYSKKSDIYYGIGGAPEGVLAAAALKCLGGKFMGRLLTFNDNERKYAKNLGIKDIDKIYSTNDLVKDDVIFAATGVTKGELLNGVVLENNYFHLNTILCHCSKSLVRNITSRYKNV